jgi:F-type H+-transporting ATPase subunit epsilon
MREFHLDIATPEGSIFSGGAESLLIHADDGDVEILAGHTDYIASVGTGRARIKSGGRNRFASHSGGILTVKNGRASLAAVTFEFAENIDVNRAKRAKEAAEEKLRTLKDDKELRMAKAKLERAISRIRTAELK